MENIKYKHWENKSFRFQDGTFYHQRFKDATASVVKIGPILVHYQVDGHPTVYSMPLQNLDPEQNVVTQVDD
jgi:hypothetical protein